MEIITNRCRLTELTPADRQNVIAVYTNPRTREFLGGALSAEEAEEKLDRFIRDRTNIGSEYILAIRSRADNAFMGLIYLSPYYDSGFYELSYELLPGSWGNGYAFEVMQACLTYCRLELGLKKVYAETQSKNVRSRRLLEKLNYLPETEIERFHEKQTVYSIDLS